jgi:hypothetical protein
VHHFHTPLANKKRIAPANHGTEFVYRACAIPVKNAVSGIISPHEPPDCIYVITIGQARINIGLRHIIPFQSCSFHYAPDVIRKNRNRIGRAQNILSNPDAEILTAAPAAARA